MCLKIRRKKRKPWAASNLQPSDLRSNAYRSLPGGQVIFSSYFHVFVFIDFNYQCGAFWFLQEVFVDVMYEPFQVLVWGFPEFFTHIMYKTTSVGLSELAGLPPTKNNRMIIQSKVVDFHKTTLKIGCDLLFTTSFLNSLSREKDK